MHDINGRYDVAILGGGIAGLTLALQLKRTEPDLEVTVIERQRHPAPEAAHKVGESSVEVQAHYLRDVLGLEEHLTRDQLHKFGLRMFFTHEGNEDITRRVNGFIDSFIDRGECNFSEEFADLFPASVFLGLLGLPEEELRMFLRLRDGILHPEKFDPDAGLDIDKRQAVMNATGEEIYAYFSELIRKRKTEPAKDIITRFLAAEVEGERLTDEEILDICFLFLIAGLDTVSDSLTCFFAFLAQHREHRRQVVENPEVIPAAVEELLRWESPVPSGVPRVATQDVELPSGDRINPGTAMMVSYGAANVDLATFGDPFEVRFDREDNPHIAFGGGVHRCLGSHLARRELRVTLREWHRRIPDYRIKPGHEKLEFPPGLRHVKDLTLTWT